MLKKIAAIFWATFAVSTPSGAAPPKDFPPRPKWQPTVAVDIERVAKTFAYYTSGKHSFAVLTHGTCVVLPDGAKDPQQAAAEIMHAILYAHPDMDPKYMDDGNWLVTYSQPAGTVVFADVVEANWAYIDKNHKDGVTKDEVLNNGNLPPNQFDRAGKIGLFGRAYMFMDAVSPKVVKVWHPPVG